MSAERPGPPDPGLQIERTTLAWLRTTLSFVVSAVVVVRLIAHQSLLFAALGAALTLPLGAVVSWYSLRRHRHNERGMRGENPLRGGALPAAVTVLAGLVGAAGITYVFLARS